MKHSKTVTAAILARSRNERLFATERKLAAGVRVKREQDNGHKNLIGVIKKQKRLMVKGY